MVKTIFDMTSRELVVEVERLRNCVDYYSRFFKEARHKKNISDQVFWASALSQSKVELKWAKQRLNELKSFEKRGKRFVR